MSDKTTRIISLIFCFLVTVIFSIHFVVAKEILKGHHPLALTCLRGLIGGGIILILFHRHIKIDLIKNHLIKLFFIGFLGFFANQLFFMYGLKLTTALNASIITNAIPLVTSFIAISLGVEKLQLRRITGILIGFLCVLSLVLAHQNDLNVNFLGDLLILGNIFIFSYAIILIKELTQKGIHYGVITAIMMLVGGICSSLVASRDAVDLLHWSFTGEREFLMFLFEVIVSTVIVYILNFYALKHLLPSQITIFIYLQPFITIISNYFILGTKPELQGWWAYIGILIGGLMVIQKDKKSISK